MDDMAADVRTDRPYLAMSLLAVCAVGCWAPSAWLSVPCAVALVLWFPGHGLVRLLPSVAALPGRAWSAVAASLVLMPIPLSRLWTVTNGRAAVFAAVVGIDVVMVVIAWRCARGPAPPMFTKRRPRWWFGVIVVWTVACAFLCFWVPHASPIPVANAAEDYVKHHAVMWSLSEYPLPLRSIFFAGDPESPRYYYEYFYLIPSAIRRLTGDAISIATAFGIGASAVAAVLTALTYLLARALTGSDGGGVVAAACVGVASGWDSIPLGVRFLLEGKKYLLLDAWCPVSWRIHHFMNGYLWCPQHMCALAALVLFCWWFRTAPRARWWVVMVPLFATAVFGLSVYHAMVFFPAAAVYVLIELCRCYLVERRRFGRLAVAVGVMGVIGFALMCVRLWHYYEMSGRLPGGLTIEWPRFKYAFLGRLVPPGPVANLLDAPWLIVVDGGLAAVAMLLVGRAVWRRLWDDAGTRLLILTGALGGLLLFTVRSNVNKIDYGFRLGLMPALIVGAVCAAELAARCRPRAVRVPGWRYWVVMFGLLIGLPAGLIEGATTGIRTRLQPEQRQADGPALTFLQLRLPRDAVVQCDPYDREPLTQVVGRKLGVFDPRDPHAAVLPGANADRARRALADVVAAFSTDDAQEAYRKLRRWGITHVLAGTPERRRFGPLRQFEDELLYECIYSDDTSAVYRLLDEPDGTAIGAMDVAPEHGDR